MRIALITLALVALLFIGSIIYSFVSKDTPFSIAKIQTSANQETPIAIETLKYQIKTDQKIEELTKKIETLAGSKVLETSNTRDTDSWSISPLEKPIVPVSGKFLARVMPKFEFTNIVNSGIFDLHLFDQSFNYSTYQDKKQETRVIAIDISYDVFLKNAKWLWNDVYIVNETKTFPFRSFYLNPPKKDNLVRIVLEAEKQTLAIEITKSKFSLLKTALLKNN
jgi:hypothetical protein